MPTGMADPRILGGVVDVLAVLNRQSIDVSTQADQSGRVLETAGQHVAVGAGTDGKHLHHEPSAFQLIDDQSSGAVLAMPNLWMSVDVPPDSNEPLVESGGLPRNLGATRGVRVGY